MAILDLILLNRLTEEEVFQKKAEGAIAAFSAAVSEDPTSYPQFLMALDWQIGPSQEIVLASSEVDSVVKKMLAEINSEFRPFQTVQFDAKRALDGRATAYVCENFTCK